MAAVLKTADGAEPFVGSNPTLPGGSLMRVLCAVVAAIRRLFYVVWGATGLIALFGFLSQARDNKRFYGTLSLRRNGAGFAVVFLAPLTLVRLTARGTERR